MAKRTGWNGNEASRDERKAPYHIDLLEDDGGASRCQRHCRVMVNGKILTDKRGRDRRFSNSIDAAIAGSKYVDDVLRPQASGGVKS